MTNDEMETRITRLEFFMEIQGAEIRMLLPGIPQAARRSALHQFARYCNATEAQILQDDAASVAAQMKLELLAMAYKTLEQSIQMIDDHEKKTS